ARGAIRIDRLDADVRGARIAMFADTPHEVLHVAPGDERVDQPIAAAVREVVFAEAAAPHAPLVVRGPEVEGARLARHAPRLRRLALEEDLLLDAEPGPGPEDLVRSRGVLGRHQIRMRAGGAPGGKPKQSGAERSEYGGSRGLRLRGV